MNYESKLYWDGQNPMIQSKEKLIEWLSKFPKDTWFTIDVIPLGNPATLQQKLYYKWRDILAGELGWDSKEMHKYLKSTYNIKSTRNLTTEEWSLFMKNVLAFAGEQNISLPLGH